MKAKIKYLYNVIKNEKRLGPIPFALVFMLIVLFVTFGNFHEESMIDETPFKIFALGVYIFMSCYMIIVFDIVMEKHKEVIRDRNRTIEYQNQRIEELKELVLEKENRNY